MRNFLYLNRRFEHPSPSPSDSTMNIREGETEKVLWRKSLFFGHYKLTKSTLIDRDPYNSHRQLRLMVLLFICRCLFRKLSESLLNIKSLHISHSSLALTYIKFFWMFYIIIDYRILTMSETRILKTKLMTIYQTR